MQAMRDQVQLEAFEAWQQAFRGTIVLPTGFGKSRVGVMALIAVAPASALIVTSKINLIKQWREECKLWGYTGPVDILCINTAYKRKAHYDLLIVDECHKTLSEEFSALYKNITYNKIMCLTATLPARIDYRYNLLEIAPLVYERSMSDSMALGAISDFEVYNVAVPLHKSIVGRFKAFNELFSKGLIKINIHKKTDPRYKDLSAFDVARMLNKSKDGGPLVRACKDFWSGMTLRKKVLYENPSKITAALHILSKASDKKWIVFTKSIKFAEEIHEKTNSSIYHSKIPSKDREAVLRDFRDNKFKILIAVDALNEGLNVPDVDCAISMSGSSTELEQIQRLGRIVRKVGNKKALFYNLYVPNTQEETWVKKRTESLNPKWITWMKI